MTAEPIENDTAEETPLDNKPPSTPLRYLHDTQVSLEKLRIGIGNRVSAIERGVDDQSKPIPEIYQRLRDATQDLEDEVDRAIAKELKNWPVYEQWLQHVKGIGPSLSGQMLALLLPPKQDRGPSIWYKAAGLAPETRRSCEEIMMPVEEVDGETLYACPVHTNNVTTVSDVPCGFVLESRLPRPRAGEGRITYHPYLRRCLWNVATSFVRNGGYYREVYDRSKRQIVELHAGDTKNWPLHRLDSVARWKMVKLFMSHLWEAYCVSLGFEPRVPYVVEKLGHHLIPRPMPSGKGKI